MENLSNLINIVLRENVTYSLAIQGYNSDTRDTVTFGAHILVTNSINIESLITFIEGRLDTSILNMESDFDITEETIIYFRYREISIEKSVSDIVSKIDYNKNPSKKKSKKDYRTELINNKMLTFIKLYQ